MVQLKVLSGKMAGTETVARHFPFRIGRGAGADLRAEDDGVWAEHLVLSFEPESGFILTVHQDALASLNGQPVREAVLRNGDFIEIGAMKLRFWLSEARQASLALREWLTWAAMVAVAAGQLALIYWLMQF